MTRWEHFLAALRFTKSECTDGTLGTNKGSLSEEEVQIAFRVAENTPWFRAVLQVIDKVEREQITEARVFAARGEPGQCVNATGGGAACEIILQRLVRLREEAVKGRM